MSHDHSHGHDHSHDHEHTHHHSQGHQVPWTEASEQWYEPGWSDPMRRTAIQAAELSAIDVVVDADCRDLRALGAASAWVSRGQLIGVAAQSASVLEEASAHPAVGRMIIQSALPQEGTASVVWSFGAMADHADHAGWVASLRDALKPGGLLLIADSEDRSPGALRSVLKAAGFRGVESRGYNLDGVRFGIVLGRRRRSG